MHLHNTIVADVHIAAFGHLWLFVFCLFNVTENPSSGILFVALHTWIAVASFLAEDIVKLDMFPLSVPPPPFPFPLSTII
jgi:hypothetical protein